MDKASKVSIEANEVVLYSKPFSLWRILTNTWVNVFLTMVFLLLFTQYFIKGAEKNLLALIILQAGLLIMITILCAFDYRGSFFYLTDKRIIYAQASQSQKKWLNLKYSELYKIYCSSYNLIVKSKEGKKFTLLCLAKPQEVLSKIEEIRKKN
jgi:hypothetical protein